MGEQVFIVALLSFLCGNVTGALTTVAAFRSRVDVLTQQVEDLKSNLKLVMERLGIFHYDPPREKATR